MKSSTGISGLATQRTVWQVRIGTCLGALASAVSPQIAWSQEAVSIGSASKISIVPRVSVTETFTNNAFLSNSNKRSELITQLTGGIRVSSTGGRLTGSLDYSLTELLYANNTSGRQSQNSLAATGRLEAVDNWAFLDFSGNIGQQSISAFGTPSNGGILTNANSTETSVFRLSPSLRGKLAGIADYEARYSITSSRSVAATVADVNQADWLLKLNGGVSAGLSWAFDANHQSVDYSGGRSTQSTILGGQLRYALNEQWGAYIKAGHEANDFSTVGTQSSDYVALGASWTPNPDLKLNLDQDSRGFTGIGASWAPSKRTSVTITRDRRQFGRTHSLGLAYRTASTAWTFTDSRGVVSSPAQGPGIQSVSLYDLLTNQYAVGEADPVKREQYDSFLQANGVKPGMTAVGGFLASTVSLQRSQQLSAAIFGARSTVSVVASRTSSSKLDTLSTALDDFSTSTLVQQSGLSVNYAYQISSGSVVSLGASRQLTAGTGVPGTSSRSLTINLATRLTRDMSAALQARRVFFDSATTPYSESAVTGNLSVQF